ncbi:unnamed protein product [Coregonus sp. 'balchen']|uniref:Uncharacterized protein n=1 Tax=Coregonus suidteri TaxID=861788 RepID=A0AAN8KF53_9TELE|nr:unnamed protein product [Coregonus sp. 'balchen']
MDQLLKLKTVLMGILPVEASFILQHVHQEELVTERVYMELKIASELTPEKTIIGLLDTLITKGGDEKCTRFLTLLQQPAIIKELPKLNEIKQMIYSDIALAPSGPAPPDAVPTSASSTVHTPGPSTAGSNIPTTPVKKKSTLKTSATTPVKKTIKSVVKKTRRNTIACGTINGVSKVKTGSSGGKYFQAVLNQEDGPMVILILDIEKHKTFLGAEKRRSSVRLKGISFEELGIIKYQEGIKFTSTSELIFMRVKNTTKMERTADQI